jgi:hypothetical protein
MAPIGGTDVVEVPYVFLPAEAYLGMFGSESDSSGDLGHHGDSDAELVEVPQVIVVGRTSFWMGSGAICFGSITADGVFGRFNLAALPAAATPQIFVSLFLFVTCESTHLA